MELVKPPLPAGSGPVDVHPRDHSLVRYKREAKPVDQSRPLSPFSASTTPRLAAAFSSSRQCLRVSLEGPFLDVATVLSYGGLLSSFRRLSLVFSPYSVAH